MSAKKQKTNETVVWPTIDGVVKICDGVDKPILQTLATVCAKLYDEALFAVWKPVESKPTKEENKQLYQAYELSKHGGQYNEGGEYKQLEGGKYEYLNGDGALVSKYDIFNKVTKRTASLASYGKVVGGFTDFHGVDQAAIPPFAALVVQPNDETEAPILILAWRGSQTLFDWLNDFACSPTLSSRWSGVTKEINAHGAYTNLVEDTFSRHEDDILALFTEFPKMERAFLTGHSLGGGIANVAHLVVRGQLALAQAGLLGPTSPWAKLGDKVIKWSACTFASPQTIVRKYETDNKPEPPLMAELDASSYNLVYECDMFPRVLGMLKYLGAFLEIVAPTVADIKLNGFVDHLNWAAKAYLFPGIAIVKPKDKFEELGVDAVEIMKHKGLSEVMAQFTHTGTVVYLAPKANNYVYLLGKTDIHDVLDVDGKKFKTLLGDPKDYAKSLGEAHGHSYDKFVFAK